MGTISLRMDEEDEKLIKEYAKTKNITVSSLFRNAVLEKIEDEIDMDLYHIAMKQHIANPQVVSFDEMMKEIDF
ncbi:ribbon-helix-helix protein copg [Trichococcus flocculiformis]|jgi:uncharacterized protein (DUF1778 family)|uniref:Ribbon-helix-helix protein copg n=1 Tax=Trichococcus flocculiformis TaxID=82803 RepID=A0AB38BEV4_9LACT|nr:MULTISPECIES: DUF6290 family protein [Trichococcus]NCB65551.1 CopG family transcriptional regulator [Bacilli bacterium]CZQ81535.1 ribbon-helix-helix protein copg [Trichococcus flocculiformis]CZQ86316.1 ribbon-helix-helix protein copg [Trichococcus sp. ES5]SFH53696.1 hypothetical protein SAMN04488507_10034 [Trichococcus flocculiformis]SHF28212.1 hypothetical protein SAMN04488048_102189 [Trichococcus flocculiformis]